MLTNEKGLATEKELWGWGGSAVWRAKIHSCSIKRKLDSNVLKKITNAVTQWFRKSDVY